MMPNTSITKPYLDAARRDLTAVNILLFDSGLRDVGQPAARQLALAVEALERAVASVAEAVERLAELPACDGSHE